MSVVLEFTIESSEFALGAALEAGAGAESQGEELEREVRLSLRHVHLPKLSRTGFVAMDEDRDLVWPGWTLPIADPVLRTE